MKGGKQKKSRTTTQQEEISVFDYKNGSRPDLQDKKKKVRKHMRKIFGKELVPPSVRGGKIKRKKKKKGLR